MGLTSLALNASAATQDSAKIEFPAALSSFKESYGALLEANNEFSRLINPHLQTFDHYKNWMDNTTRTLSGNDLDEANIQSSFLEYRKLLKDDKTCASASLQTIQSDLQFQLSTLEAKLKQLKIASIEAQKSSDKKLKKEFKKETTEAEIATEKARKVINDYSGSLQNSTVCATLSNYDLVLVAADTTLQSKSLRLSDYLDNSVMRRERESIKREALIYLSAVEDGFARSLERGDLSKALILLNRLDANVAFGTAASKLLSDVEKLEIDQKKQTVKQNIRSLAASSGFPKPEGFQTLVKSKAKYTHELLTQIERQSVRGSDQIRFNELKSYCLATLKMSASEPYSAPSFRSSEDVLEFEAMLETVQVKLKEIEKSRNLAVQ